MELDPHKLRDATYRSQVFTILMRDYQDRIYRYCVSRLGDIQGEEIAQDVFVTAWENLPKFRQDSTVSTWLTGIAKNKCIQAFRNRGRRQAIVATFVADIRHQSHADSASSPEEEAMEEARRQELSLGLLQMREDDQLLLQWRYQQGLSVTEVAELLGKSEPAVRKRLLRALGRLRQIVNVDALT